MNSFKEGGVLDDNGDSTIFLTEMCEYLLRQTRVHGGGTLFSPTLSRTERDIELSISIGIYSAAAVAITVNVTRTDNSAFCPIPPASQI